MSSVSLTLIFDSVLGVLLITTILYCARLSQRIKILRDSRGEFAKMIAQFDIATERASASIHDLQNVSKKIADALQLKIEKANFLADDLAFLIEKSNKLVVQLEHAKLEHTSSAVNIPRSLKPERSLDNIMQTLVTEPKSTSLKPPAVDAVMHGPDAPEEKLVPRTSAERDLIAALKAGGRR